MKYFRYFPLSVLCVSCIAAPSYDRQTADFSQKASISQWHLDVKQGMAGYELPFDFVSGQADDGTNIPLTLAGYDIELAMRKPTGVEAARLAGTNYGTYGVFTTTSNFLGTPVVAWDLILIVDSGGVIVNQPSGKITIRRSPELDSGDLVMTRSVSIPAYTWTGQFSTSQIPPSAFGSSADNLGNHTATTNLDLVSNNIERVWRIYNRDYGAGSSFSINMADGTLRDATGAESANWLSYTLSTPSSDPWNIAGDGNAATHAMNYRTTTNLIATLAEGDNLGDHSATQALDMGTYPITNVSEMYVHGTGLYANIYAGSTIDARPGRIYLVDAVGPTENLCFSHNGIQLRVHENVLANGNISADGIFYGDGSGVTNLDLSAHAGTNLTWSGNQLHASGGGSSVTNNAGTEITFADSNAMTEVETKLATPGAIIRYGNANWSGGSGTAQATSFANDEWMCHENAPAMVNLQNAGGAILPVARFNNSQATRQWILAGQNALTAAEHVWTLDSGLWWQTGYGTNHLIYSITQDGSWPSGVDYTGAVHDITWGIDSYATNLVQDQITNTVAAGMWSVWISKMTSSTNGYLYYRSVSIGVE